MNDTIRPPPEAIACSIVANREAHIAGVIGHAELIRRQNEAWQVADLHALTDATVRALATIEAKSAPHGPGTLDVLLAAEMTAPEEVCDAVALLAGDGSFFGTLPPSFGRGYVINGRTLAALVRALTGAA